MLQGENTSYSREDDLVVASIQTIRARSAPDWVHVVIIDEVHILHQAHIKLMERWNALPFIGLSATPLRKGLGRHFTNLVRGPSIRWLTENGFLVPVRGFAPASDAVADAIRGVKVQGGDYAEADLGQAINQKSLVGDIVSTWQERGEDRQTLCFAASIAHSKAIRDDFEAVGVSIAHIDAYTPDDERREIVAAFKAREIRMLTSVNVLGIGFDVPDASCLILARPTLSESLHIQQMGRGIRRATDKTDCVVLDHSGNTLKHGLPIHFEVPDLDTSEKGNGEVRKKKDRDTLIKCTHCGALMERDQWQCPECGMDRPQRKSNVIHRDGELIEFGAAGIERESPMEERKTFYRRCMGLLNQQGGNPSRAYWLTKSKYKGFEAPWEWRNLPPMEPTQEIERYIQHQNIRYRKSQRRNLN
ncbi:putative helicase [Imhoffiella purpurea]|uniref:Putative helicase n=1 Tax=Imhoffiella purpurea TaxID=1249627 RepID=W9UV25_9GAMM|nr:putative helicase [Imhoffiella purpurea]